MGSIATLDVGAFQITFGQNEWCMNHSDLFLRSDLGDALYFYADDGDGDIDGIEERFGEAIAIRKPAYVRRLALVRQRLDLLGYSLAGCRRAYEETEWSIWIDDADIPSFYDLAAAVCSLNVPDASCAWHGKDICHLILSRLHEEGLVEQEPARDPFQQDHSIAHELDPYIILRLLAENPANDDAEVVWRLDDVVTSGCLDGETLHKAIPQQTRWLVVTEGPTDGRILRESLDTLLPELRDFFEFVDMKENYPFTGTGSVLQFCKGLIRIHVMNQILVVLDNDTEGRKAYREIAKLDPPENFRFTTLPDLEVCKSVRTIGPSGENREDINGRAVAIECFLDIWRNPADEPLVQWANSVQGSNADQGALIGKEHYEKRFRKRRKLRDYDMRALKALWDHLIAVCTA